MKQPAEKKLSIMPDGNNDREVVTDIFKRYHNKFHDLDFNEPITRTQLALDIGMLIGLCLRLLSEEQKSKV